MELPPDVREKFDALLASVKEPQSELNLAELGMVKKISYHKAETTIVVYMNYPAMRLGQCPACAAASSLVTESLERDIRTVLEKDFPDWTIEVLPCT